MKKVIIIGAGGSLAGYVISELEKQEDVQQTLFLRNKNKLNQTPSNTTVVQGDVMDYDTLKDAIKGQDIVYINLAGNLEAMASNIVKAMKETGVKRVIGISSIGIYELSSNPQVRSYRKLADILEESGLDYTVIRPDWFTNGSEVDYHITHKPDPEIGGAVSRRSIAAFVASIVEKPESYKNDNVGISKV